MVSKRQPQDPIIKIYHRPEKEKRPLLSGLEVQRLYQGTNPDSTAFQS
jgi:hypothetical protein